MLTFNKKLTKALIKAGAPLPKITKQTLDWWLDEKEELCGMIRFRPFRKNVVFMIRKSKDRGYRLFTCDKNNLYIYYISDIDEFLKNFGIMPFEVSGDFKSQFIESLKIEDEGFSTGFIEINDDKVYLYDYIED